MSNSFDCSKIPVRFVNHIQNFGILIGVEKKSHLISHVSENIETAFGVPGHTLLGKSIFLPELAPPLKKIAYFIQQDTQKLSSQEPIDTDEDHELIFHKQDKYDLFEWLFFKKKPENEMNNSFHKITLLYERLRRSGMSTDAVQSICEELKSIFLFDKVLIYRFRSDGHGEVIGEARDDSMEDYLGLRFPASDVPPQVRETYLLNPLRFIQNAYDSPIQILSLSDQPALDLTDCLLKGVSPVHQDYIRAMNLTTSLSLALIVQDKLWGLLCFHHRTPKELPYPARSLIHFTSQLLGMLIEIHEDETKINLELEVKKKLLHIAHFDDTKPKDFIDIFITFTTKLLKILNADGCCISYQGKIEVSGKTPPLAFLHGLIDWLAEGPLMGSEYFFTDHLIEKYPQVKEFIHLAAGIMAYRISPGKKEMIVWFRADQITNVHWGGNPNRAEMMLSEGGLSPHHSFSLYVETVYGKSVPWLPEEILTANEIQDFMKKVIIERLYVEKRIIEGEVLQFQLAVDAVKNGIFILSSDKKILWCNSYFSQVFQDQGDIKGHSFVHVLQRAKADYLFPEVDEQQNGLCEHEVGFGEDPKKFLMFYLNAYTIELIGERRYIGVAYDMTNIKETTEKLKKLNEQKDNFLRMAAHDLRNPLASILMSASILKSQNVEVNAAKKLNEIIERQGQFMLAMLNKFVDISVLQNIEINEKKEQTQLQKFFDEITAANKILFDAKGINLRTAFRFETQEAFMDRIKIKQVIENLLSNAIKYSYPDTTVVFKVHATKNQLYVEVEDQGLGIPLEEQDRIFMPLANLSPKPTGNESSTGVGLSICKKMIQSLHGEMGFTSTPQKGSKFYFKIPF
ncbi:MAG: GAF domain-containing protein [Chlamydiales bacterium]|nr:GAF domain-containing protein [Chlamydiales bacterium]